MKVYHKKALGLSLFVLKDGKDVTVVMKAGKKSTKAHMFKWYSKRQLKVKSTDALETFIDVTTRRTVYFYESGMDCDGVSSGSGSKYKNIFEAEKSQEHAYEWADGPLYFSRMTKQEYLESKPHYRDHGMEAHEDGHPHNIHY